MDLDIGIMHSLLTYSTSFGVLVILQERPDCIILCRKTKHMEEDSKRATKPVSGHLAGPAGQIRAGRPPPVQPARVGPADPPKSSHGPGQGPGASGDQLQEDQSVPQRPRPSDSSGRP